MLERKRISQKSGSGEFELARSLATIDDANTRHDIHGR